MSFSSPLFYSVCLQILKKKIVMPTAWTFLLLLFVKNIWFALHINTDLRHIL
jgi:hypothetical protein